MADIFYEVNGKAYANLTNKCCLKCSFCIRNNGDRVGSSNTLWHDEGDPGIDEIMKALKDFHLENYSDLVFCGYGEPTYALDNMVKVGNYVREHYPNIKMRLDTNGLGDVINKKQIVPLLEPFLDSVSVSLNAADSDLYDYRCRPAFDNSYETMLNFVKECKGHIPDITMTVVDIIPDSEIEKCRQITEDLGVNYRVRIYAD